MTPSTSSSRRPRGTTLIETCVVVAVVALVATTAVPSLRSLLDARRLDGAAGELAADLQLVRVEAVARNLPLRLSFEATAAGSCYLIHTGSAADCRCDERGAARCQGGAEAIKTVLVPVADRITLASNAPSLLFDPVHGTSSPTATVTVLDSTGREVRHIVNVLGRVRSCSPAARVPGYRPC